MKLVIDSGADLSFEEAQKLGAVMLPLKVEIDGKSYQSGFDIDPSEFYDLMDASSVMPITSTPSIGEFTEVYNRLAEEDQDILSLHISSGLSATYNTGLTAAGMIKKANVTVIDALTLSAGYAWQVKAAAQMITANFTLEEIRKILRLIQVATTAHFTLPDLKYLIAGGRISHLKGLLASLLGIKPVIEVSQEDGKYYDKVKKRSFMKSIDAIPQLLLNRHVEGAVLQAQIVTAANPSGGELLRQAMDKVFKCHWLPDVTLGTALGAHTGRGMVGVVCAAEDALPALP